MGVADLREFAKYLSDRTQILVAITATPEEGHVFCPQEELLGRAAALLGASGAPLEAALEGLRRRGAVVQEDLPEAPAAVYDQRLHASETAVARSVGRLLASPPAGGPVDPGQAVSWIQQRLGLALALLSDPELIVLDEPTTGLDPQGVKEVRDLVRELARERGMTVFLSSHLLHEVEMTATRMAVIHQGVLRVEGTVRELLGGGEAVAMTLELL